MTEWVECIHLNNERMKEREEKVNEREKEN
jgi:hypothetical protein